MPEEHVAPADTGLKIDFGSGPQVASAAELIALLQLLAEHGYHDGRPGEDEESQRFADDVRDLNPDWQPGEIPRVPAGYGSVPDELRRPEAWRQPRRDPIIYVPARFENVTRPREHRSRSRTRPTRGSPDDDPSEPPLVEIPLEAFRLELRRALGDAA